MALGQVTLASGQNTVADDKLKDRIDYRLETSDVVKKYDLHVKVDAGVVMLKGTVATAAQKTEAGSLARITGVSDVNNQIAVDELMDGSRINVDTNKRIVTLTGTVKTDAAKTRAVALAYHADGVTNVVDHLTVVK